MTAAELKQYFRDTLQSLRTIAQEYLSLDAIVDFITQSITTGIPAWTNLLTFNTDGSGSGAYSTHPDTNGALRFWKSKINGNIGNAPPTNPAITEDANWIEVSPSPGSAIKEWSAGIFGVGLIIVAYNDQLYKLANPIRPYHSTNIITELAAGDWVLVSASPYIAPSTDVTGAPILLDSSFFNDILFTGSAAISTNKTLSFTNDANGKRKRFLFTITGTPVITLPATCKLPTFQGGWDDGAKQLDFGQMGAGDFALEFVWKSVGAYFQTTLSGPF